VRDIGLEVGRREFVLQLHNGERVMADERSSLSNSRPHLCLATDGLPKKWRSWPIIGGGLWTNWRRPPQLFGPRTSWQC
jgi:hypothetical protein